MKKYERVVVKAESYEDIIAATRVPPAETARRLKLLSDKLKKVESGFDMSMWAYVNPRGLTQSDLKIKNCISAEEDKWSRRVKRLKKPLCGTSACALGWATTIPELGLYLVLDSSWQNACSVLSDKYVRPGGLPLCTEPLAVGAITFGITLDESEHLFLPGDLVTMNKEKAIRRINRLAASYKRKAARQAKKVEEARGPHRTPRNHRNGE
jgi:hypothetical protein